MQKILVVSDNARLVEFFRLECEAQSISKNFEIDYRYSSRNTSPEPLIQIGMVGIDLKDKNTVETVIKEYFVIFSLHCKQIFPAKIVESIVCINLHPGLNPFNRGWFPQVFSIINKKPIGATLHLMDCLIDHGQILDQIEVAYDIVDTSLTLYEKVYGAEKLLIKKNLYRLLSKSFTGFLPQGEGNYNGIKDFNALCKLDLDSIGSLGNHIDLLRALTHGGYKNAYFYDGDGAKIYVKISLERESSGV